MTNPTVEQTLESLHSRRIFRLDDGVLTIFGTRILVDMPLFSARYTFAFDTGYTRHYADDYENGEFQDIHASVLVFTLATSTFCKIYCKDDQCLGGWEVNLLIPKTLSDWECDILQAFLQCYLCNIYGEKFKLDYNAIENQL